MGILTDLTAREQKKARATAAGTATCHAGCQQGNPWRGYICRCQKCKGLAHGSDTITLAHIADILDRKLRSKKRLPLDEHEQWVALAETVHNQLDPRRRKRRRRRAA